MAGFQVSATMLICSNGKITSGKQLQLELLIKDTVQSVCRTHPPSTEAKWWIKCRSKKNHHPNIFEAFAAGINLCISPRDAVLVLVYHGRERKFVPSYCNSPHTMIREQMWGFCQLLSGTFWSYTLETGEIAIGWDQLRPEPHLSLDVNKPLPWLVGHSGILGT